MSDILLDGHLHRGCGGHYVQVTMPVTIKLSGMAATVSRSAYRCDVCGDEQRTLEQREAAEQTALDAPILSVGSQEAVAEPRPQNAQLEIVLTIVCLNRQLRSCRV